MTLSDFLPEARCLSSAYDLLAANSLAPAVPADFPWPPGFGFRYWLNAVDDFLFFKERTFMGLFGSSADEDLVLIVGTHTFLQWVKDAEGDPRSWTTSDGVSGNVEHGFSDVYGGISVVGASGPVITLRQFLEAQQKTSRPVTIVGHSLGAAVGGIAAADASFPRFVLFAMPKWGDLGLTKALRAKARTNSIVVRNSQDYVPMQPPLPIYQSWLPEITFNSDELGVGGSAEERHSMNGCYLRACST
jgi:hypothetical protein